VNRAGSKYSPLEYLILILYLALAVYVCTGFFYSDPKLAYEGVGSHVSLALWGLRLSLPLAFAFLLCLYLLLRNNRVQTSTLGLIVFGVFFALLISYPVISHIYYNRSPVDPAEFHPYFQLSPPEYKARTDSDSKDVLRIFCLGGSTTEWKNSEEVGWPTLLEKQLIVLYPGRKLEVHNLGRSWYTTQHTLFNYMANLKQHKPDMLIIMHAVNDLIHNADFGVFTGGIPFRGDYGHFYGPVYRLIKRHSLFSSLGSLLNNTWYFEPRQIIDTDVFPGLVPFRRNLENLIQVAQNNGTRVVLLTQPYIFKQNMNQEEIAVLYVPTRGAVGQHKEWSIATARRGMEQYNSTLRQIASENDLSLIDLDSSLPRNLEHFIDDVHYTDKSFEMISKLISTGLEKADLL